MPQLMRCLYCGLLQDEPAGVKTCQRCGGELAYEQVRPLAGGSYLQVQMELDQIQAPAGTNFDRYVLITLRTPREVPPEHAAPTVSGRPDLTFAAVLDNSGSMNGEKLVQARDAIRQAVSYLHEGDIFSLVTFESNVRVVVKPSDMNSQNRKGAQEALNNIHATGMTALCGGLEKGIELAGESQKDNTLVLLLSDGQANVGETDLEKVGYRATQARQKGMVVSTIGVGLDYNEALMSEIAMQGGGRFYHITSAAQIPGTVAGELGEAALLAAKDVKVRLTVPGGAVASPLSAVYPVSQNGDQVVISVGDLPLDLEQEIPIRLTIPGKGAGTRLPVEGSVAYQTPAGGMLEGSLNRVTIRCAAKGEFQLREGMIPQVAETVFQHMKAAQGLYVARAFASAPATAEKTVQEGINRLREYAFLLGEDRVKKEEVELREYMAPPPSPAAAKQRVSDSMGFIRKRKG